MCNKNIITRSIQKYTGIFAISENGVVGWDLYEKSRINSDRMIEFLEANITNKFKNKLIFLDNANSHRNLKVKEVINKGNHLLYFYIISYIKSTIITLIY